MDINFDRILLYCHNWDGNFQKHWYDRNLIDDWEFNELNLNSFLLHCCKIHSNKKLLSQSINWRETITCDFCCELNCKLTKSENNNVIENYVSHLYLIIIYIYITTRFRYFYDLFPNMTSFLNSWQGWLLYDSIFHINNFGQVNKKLERTTTWRSLDSPCNKLIFWWYSKGLQLDTV